ncbi:hypothetical protein BON22_3713 [Cyberlindnera fabianii]|uniref:Uncharacterized protein n=1 Tax=Cyberlindnera fabianii TaxID=36022 RepID=A0A1V2L3K1_CYBFA|nr:hypothetical protein BON22_3713 [Cyberlindnera fabianii]
MNHTSPSLPILFKSFVFLFVASLLFGGITIGCLTQAYFTETEDVVIAEDMDSAEKQHRYRSNSGAHSLKKMVSLKASAATLVDTAGRHGDDYNSNSSNNNNYNPLSRSQSNRSKNSSKASLSAFSYKRSKTTTKGSIPNYSIKKLSVINQSSSTMNITELGSVKHSSSANTIKSGLFTPTISRSKDFESSSKNMLMERDALKRIPPALLPPHLRPHDKNSFGQNQRSGSDPMISTSHTTKDISHHYFQEEPVMQQIPRAATVNPIMPYFKENKGMRTISLEDYERNYDRIQMSQNSGFQPYRTSDLFSELPHEEHAKLEMEPIPSSDAIESIVELAQESAVSPDDSTDKAMKYLEDAQDAGNADQDMLKAAMDQQTSSINLQALEAFDTMSTKGKGHSPHKSIFGHSRKGSQFSNRGNSMSMPGSPVRRSKSKRQSPRKLGIKNLSLSSIVYKDDKNDAPDFSYVHELQNSPSRKKTAMTLPAIDTNTPIKRSKTVNVLQDATNTTPDSSWSEHSHHSVFPSEVIGEYDKEKWKTMMRLKMVGDENSYNM